MNLCFINMRAIPAYKRAGRRGERPPRVGLSNIFDCSPVCCFDPIPMISAVIPVYNEQYNVTSLLEEIASAGQNAPVTEIIFVDDASQDDTHSMLAFLRTRFPQLRVLRHSDRSGQSAALWTGVSAAKNGIIVTLDGDGQNDPADIVKLFDLFQKQGGIKASIMVAGQREKRNDNLVRRLSSRLANGIRSALLKDNTRDTGCSLKMFRKDDYLKLPCFNHMHRFLPALMMREGVAVCHVNVSHRPREKGMSKYGTLDRLAAGIIDIVGVMWLMKRARKAVTVTEKD